MVDENIALVRYSRRESQGILLGLDLFSVIALAITVAPPVLVLVTTQNLLGALALVFVLSPVALTGLVKRHGIAWVRWLVWWGRFQLRKVQGVTVFRRKAKPVVAGVVELPLLGQRLEVWQAESGACVVWDKGTGHASVICAVASAGMARHNDQTTTAYERQQHIAGLMSVASGWTRRRQIARIEFLERCRPGSVVRQQRDFEALNVSGELADSYMQALRLAADASVSHPQAICITIDTNSAAGAEAVKQNGGGKIGVLRACEMEMQASSEALYHAGFTRVEWMSPREWAAWGRTLVDPLFEPSVDVREGSELSGVAPELAAPMSLDEHKDIVETDSAFHRVYWVADWPRLETYPGFMGELAMAETYQGLPVRHTLRLVMVPVPLEQALGRIRKARNTWRQNADLKARQGKQMSIADTADWENLDARERELISGQGELRFTGFVVVSALTEELLHQYCASMEVAAAAAGVELLRLTYQQGAALVSAAYPAGLGVMK